MKKRIIIVTILLSAILALSLSACTIPSTNYISDLTYVDNSYHKVRIANSALYSDTGYTDYAKDVYLDKVKYPALNNQGMFWTKWDETTKKIVEVPASSPEGAALVDPNKPILINVHGMMNDGATATEQYNFGGTVEKPAVFGQNHKYYTSTTKMWMDKGYNVAYFKYEKFACEMNNPPRIEEKAWATDGEVGMRFIYPDGTYENNVSEYSLAEHFAAEYIRAINLLPDSVASQDIRIAAHSMGGEIAAGGIFLLTELADAGQISPSKLPNRFAMLDTYFSVNLKIGDSLVYWGPKNIKINWSGKKLVNNRTSDTIIEALKDISANGVAIEYYTYPDSALRAAMTKEHLEIFKSLCTYTMLKPDASCYTFDYSPLIDGHVAVQRIYLCMIYADTPPLDITNGSDKRVYAPSAAMSTADILALKGTEYVIVDGYNTYLPTDDTFMRVLPA